MNTNTIIKIKITDDAKLKTALLKAEGRSRLRLASPEMIRETARQADMRLDMLKLCKKDRVGAIATNKLEKAPNNYLYAFESTYYELTRYPSGWYITNISRKNGYCTSYGERSKPLDKVKITLKQQISALKHWDEFEDAYSFLNNLDKYSLGSEEEEKEIE